MKIFKTVNAETFNSNLIILISIVHAFLMQERKEAVQEM